MFRRSAHLQNHFQDAQNSRSCYRLACMRARKLRTVPWDHLPFSARAFLRTTALGSIASITWAVPAHANTSLMLAENPLWGLFFIAAWITVLNPVVRGHSWRFAALLSAILSGAAMYFTQATLPWIFMTSLLCVVLAYWQHCNGLLWLLLASSVGYRRKFVNEDPIACSGIQGELGGGGYRHTGISLRGQRAARSWT